MRPRLVPASSSSTPPLHKTERMQDEKVNRTMSKNVRRHLLQHVAEYFDGPSNKFENTTSTERQHVSRPNYSDHACAIRTNKTSRRYFISVTTMTSQQATVNTKLDSKAEQPQQPLEPCGTDAHCQSRKLSFRKTFPRVRPHSALM